ncbi:MAG: hypothetical protein CMH98_00970, partial [Oceanospirillaceae bacterium]|nr:hypothetical protein [Oceanospirillaceae bacterium]
MLEKLRNQNYEQVVEILKKTQMLGLMYDEIEGRRTSVKLTEEQKLNIIGTFVKEVLEKLDRLGVIEFKSIDALSEDVLIHQFGATDFGNFLRKSGFAEKVPLPKKITPTSGKGDAPRALSSKVTGIQATHVPASRLGITATENNPFNQRQDDDIMDFYETPGILHSDSMDIEPEVGDDHLSPRSYPSAPSSSETGDTVMGTTTVKSKSVSANLTTKGKQTQIKGDAKKGGVKKGDRKKGDDALGSLEGGAQTSQRRNSLSKQEPYPEASPSPKGGPVGRKGRNETRYVNEDLVDRTGTSMASKKKDKNFDKTQNATWNYHNGKNLMNRSRDQAFVEGRRGEQKGPIQFGVARTNLDAKAGFKGYRTDSDASFMNDPTIISPIIGSGVTSQDYFVQQPSGEPRPVLDKDNDPGIFRLFHDDVKIPRRQCLWVKLSSDPRFKVIEPCNPNADDTEDSYFHKGIQNKVLQILMNYPVEARFKFYLPEYSWRVVQDDPEKYLDNGFIQSIKGVFAEAYGCPEIGEKEFNEQFFIRTFATTESMIYRLVRHLEREFQTKDGVHKDQKDEFKYNNWCNNYLRHMKPQCLKQTTMDY